MRVHLDYRYKLVGNAVPGSGGVVTLTHACAKGGWQAAFGGEQRAGLHLVLDQFAHLGHFLL